MTVKNRFSVVSVLLLSSVNHILGEYGKYREEGGKMSFIPPSTSSFQSSEQIPVCRLVSVSVLIVRPEDQVIISIIWFDEHHICESQTFILP